MSIDGEPIILMTLYHMHHYATGDMVKSFIKKKMLIVLKYWEANCNYLELKQNSIILTRLWTMAGR
jgi:hypothetical protein